MLLALIEHEHGVPSAGSMETLSVLRRLSAQLGAETAVIAFGDCEGLVEQVAPYRIGTVYAARHELLEHYSPDSYGQTVAQLLNQLRPEALLAAGSDHGNEVLAQAAARTSLPFASNCRILAAARPGDAWQVTRVRGGGMLFEDAELTSEIPVISLSPGAQVSPDEVHGADTLGNVPSPRAVAAEHFAPQLDPNMARAHVVEREQRSAGVSLATAPVVVSGGRGVGGPEGYASLEELAQLLGGAVGCSRVATDSGWRSHSDQVGLTGTKIAPNLYIACGISGATQHWVGCMNAKSILAINTDPDAPMVTKAAYAVIGDIHEVLPAVIAEIRRRRVPAQSQQAAQSRSAPQPAGG